MKKLIVFLYLGIITYAKPSYPIHPGVGAIYKGPNSETIIAGPDGSIITAEADGGVVGVNGEGAVVEAVAHSAAASAVVKSTSAHHIYDHSAASAAASVAAASHSSLANVPIVVQEPIAVVEPVLVADDQAVLTGPSGSILRHGENAIVSGPASITIRDGHLIASIPKAEINAVIVEPPRTLIAPQAALIDTSLIGVPAVGVNVAEANAHLADINLINEANRAAFAEAQLSHINSANAAALAAEADRVALAQQANSVAIAEDANRAALIAEANRAALVGTKTHLIKTGSPHISIAEANAINSAALAHSRDEALIRANLEAQLSHGVALGDINAINAAHIAHSQDGLARANLEAQFSHAVVPQVSAAAINSVNLAHAHDAISQANLEAEYAAKARAEALNAEAERNAVTAQSISRHQVGALNTASLRPDLNPIITQGNQIISNAVISSTPFVEVTPISSLGPIVSTTARPIIVPPRANTFVSSTIAPTLGYVAKALPTQNVIVSSTLKPVPSYLASVDAVPIISHPKAVITPVVDAGQVIYQSSSSSSSQSHSSASSQSRSSNVLSSGHGGVVNLADGHIISAPVAVSNSDYSQWQESFADSRHDARESLLSSQIHRGVLH